MPESGDPPPSNCTPTPSRSTQITATPLPSAEEVEEGQQTFLKIAGDPPLFPVNNH